MGPSLRLPLLFLSSHVLLSFSLSQNSGFWKRKEGSTKHVSILLKGENTIIPFLLPPIGLVNTKDQLVEYTSYLSILLYTNYISNKDDRINIIPGITKKYTLLYY